MWRSAVPASSSSCGCDLAGGLLFGRALCKSQCGVKSTSCVRKANVFLEKWSLLEKAAVGSWLGGAAHVVVIKARPFLDPGAL